LHASTFVDILIFVNAKESLSSMSEMPVTCCAPLGASALTDEEAEATASLYRALGDSARVRIVNLVATSTEPVCACSLIEPVGLSQGTVSHHLKKLVEAGLLVREQRGKWAYFSLNTEAMERLASLADLTPGGCCR
jgi:ArsR family transcriptional regulator, arsenate/arsenite/antimonite-responsive transcriptional repressor